MPITRDTQITHGFVFCFVGEKRAPILFFCGGWSGDVFVTVWRMLVMSAISLVITCAHPFRPAPDKKRCTGDYGGLSPVTLQQPPSRPDLAPVSPPEQGPVFFRVLKPRVMHGTDTRFFECRGETAFRETRLPGHGHATAHPPKPAPLPRQAVREVFPHIPRCKAADPACLFPLVASLPTCPRSLDTVSS